MSSLIADNLARVQDRIAAAASRAGRDASAITLVAVTKRQSIQSLQETLNTGCTDLGENYVQEAQAKRDSPELLPENKLPCWHLIGHLQSNKAKQAIALFDLIQSVDSLKLAQALAHQAQHQEKTQAVLVQVHLGDEETKTGFAPDEALEAIAEMATLPGLDVQGLMGIAPGMGDPHPHFAALRRLFEQMPPQNRRTLSMGMTGDFESAIAEGTTMVRIGTAIFGPRQ
jgi:pyridoxal phosphate enzyme (YggS family)